LAHGSEARAEVQDLLSFTISLISISLIYFDLFNKFIDFIKYFHITPFLARRSRNIMHLNPMSHGTEDATKSAHYPVMYLCSR
jgi:hypothetical protein